MRINLYSITISKYLILGFLCFGIFSYSHSQETEINKELEGIALKMFIDTNNKDYDAILEMTHPKVFDLVSKEDMLGVLQSMFEGTEEMSIAISDEIPEFEVTEVFEDTEHNSDFAFVIYDLNMSMTFHQESFDDETKEMMIKMMKLQNMDVEFISDNSMNVFMPNRMTILINDESTKNKWAMINYDPSSPIFFQLLSAPVLEKAKNYYQDLMIENKKQE